MGSSFLCRRLIALGIGLSALAGVTARADPLEMSLSPAAETGTVTVTLTNTGADTLSVLTWDTPFEETLSSDVFRVERAIKKWPLIEYAPYKGREVKRAVPLAEHYLTLGPGEELSRDVQLNAYYQIDLSDIRQVRFDGHIRYTESESSDPLLMTRKLSLPAELDVTDVQSNSLSVKVQPALERRILTPAYNNCSVEEQSDILAATEVAEQLLVTAVDDLSGLAVGERPASPRYVTWFGSYTEGRYSRVLSNFQLMQTALQEETMRFDCGCDEQGTFAYVYPNRPYDVFLCPEFRRANIDGTDSRAGTIIHELSHFTILADTDDHVYSQRGAQSLANTDPAKAISNADNHEYFAENTPFLAITAGEITLPEVTALELDVPVSGDLVTDDFVVYEVEGARRIELTSTGGDADLYVYTDAALTAQSCRSLNITSQDSCEIFANGTVYVEVRAYTSTSYELLAVGEEELTPTDEAPVALLADIPQSASLELGERIVYAVTGASLVNLESLSGDADLYVFDSLEFDNTTLVCASATLSATSSSESCSIPSTPATYYILVVAFTSSQFTVVASTEVTDTVTTGVTTDMGRLLAGESRSESIQRGDFHVFVLGEAVSVQVISSTGDADLAIYDSPDFDNAQLLCLSEAFSSDSLIDQCDVQSEGDHYIAIYGYEASSYVISSTAAEPVVPDDDPVPDLPVVPDTPDVPDSPVVPVVPVVPDTPDVPDSPVVPVVPVVPDTPDVPVVPNKPDTTDTTADPEVPAADDPLAPDADTDDANTDEPAGSLGGGALGVGALALLLISVAVRRRRVRA